MKTIEEIASKYISKVPSKYLVSPKKLFYISEEERKVLFCYYPFAKKEIEAFYCFSANIKTQPICSTENCNNPVRYQNANIGLTIHHLTHIPESYYNGQ